MNTPWGHADTVVSHGRGLLWVSTPSHGGFMITDATARQRLTPEARQYGERFGGYLCYEEDCDAAIVLFEIEDTRREFTRGVSSQELLESLSYWKQGYLEARGIQPVAEIVERKRAFEAQYGGGRRVQS